MVRMNPVRVLSPLAFRIFDDISYTLYGDGNFQKHQWIFNRPAGEIDDPHTRAMSTRYNAMRVAVEHSFGTLTNLFKFSQLRQATQAVWAKTSPYRVT
jgi:hypothetical protein